MARKKAEKPKVPAIEEPKVRVVPIRFDLPIDVYEELTRQARTLGLSRASYAKMLVMKCVAAKKEGKK